MKTQFIPGWAVIFATTLFLVVCASQNAQAVNYYKLAGADATAAQVEEQSRQFYEDSAIFVSPDWLDVRESMIEERERALLSDEGSVVAVTPDWVDVRESMIEGKERELARRENAVAINQAWQDERARHLAVQADVLDHRENYLAINQSWLDERAKRLAVQADELDQRENYLAINQAWLNEREMQLSQTGPDLTRKEDMLAFEKSFIDQGRSTPEQPGRCYAQVFVPAEYLAVASKVLISDPSEDGAPARFQTVTKHVKVSDDHMTMKEVLCQTDMTENRIKEIQRALSLGGYDAGPIDGVLGPQTMSAVKEFQKEHGLIVANHLTIETVKTLGLQ